MKNAVVLLSGGMDSATVLALAKADGFACHCLSFRYGQRHSAELTAAAELARSLGATDHRVVDLNLGLFGGSALTDDTIQVPDQLSDGIPVTYVPARNTVFLAVALAWAEVLKARDLFIGVNAVDYSGYPDCRPEFIQAFETMANLATKAGVEGDRIRIRTPLIDLSKAEIIRRGVAAGVDFSRTVSCYSADAEGRACGTCDACRLRAKGFADAGIPDVTRYRP
ncbi:7-cyano-7-deazaguanine synthase QueC [Ectothiorhodospira lacustris]|uniref:7-cyano-7-deazaguanine synthase QueC n=1 Tax=Ectothiorhodospira lacustris TaxID=2899127 RepID=UPI001EE8A770|nr:7-cyano-7-deazaguanine synthase QueC [Ectothiorhodospira lacustris]MCG5500925.1 7-cyano-7-deazaguanine synthase QueC [Ectothiorhodospira lacustris]MCG5510604.1 7-cyano-7-deazaguanine synthase QueC [Ectothiorhodospira lacustris]MCG5521296.1 7-cyano-7-deazaguanine synthase QueC [Ectothiorhodospira lacustris]